MKCNFKHPQCFSEHFQRTMDITEEEAFVKENYTLSREWVTAYTHLSTEKRVSFKLEFILKGKSKNVNLSPPENFHN